MSGAAGESRASFLSRITTPQLVLAAVVLLLASLGIAAYPSIGFVREFVIDALQPVARFDANEPYAFTDPDPYARYRLAVETDQRNTPPPEMDVRLDTIQGPAQREPLNAWSSMMGREYTHFMRIAPPPGGTMEIEITTEGNEDFVLFREYDDVYARALRRATPLWVISLIPLALGLAAVLLVTVRLVRSSGEVTLRVD